MLVSGFLAGRGFENNGGDLYDECYTNWGDPNDVIRTDTPHSGTPGKNDMLVSKNAFDGVGCGWPKGKRVTRYQADTGENSYLQIDLQIPRRIQEVTILVFRVFQFENVNIYLGNTNDYMNSSVYFQYATAKKNFSELVINGNSALEGRFLTFFKPDSTVNALGFFDLQVLPAH